MKIKYFLYVLLLVFPCFSFAQHNSPIYLVIKSRLNLCHDVASYKIRNNIAIENKKQEQVVLEKAAKSARRFSLQEHAVLNFTQALMESCKQIQQADFNAPSSQPHKIASLTEIRTELGKLNQKLFTLLSLKLNTKSELTDLQYANFSKQLGSLPLSQQQKQLLFNQLKSIKLAKPQQQSPKANIQIKDLM